jgi:RyR domain-containing protein
MWAGSVEPLAQAIHQRWRSDQAAAGNPAPGWHELDESRRESSRDQARDIPAKLSSVGCAIAPMSSPDQHADFTFTGEEVETLAAAEHARWVRERMAAGWTPGDKDAARKKTPYLVPFDELPADVAEYDRNFVREIPRLLASVGLQVVRKPSSTDSSRRDQIH